MTKLSRILVPTDLSEHSRRALLYGSWLATKQESALVILHVAAETSLWQLSAEFELYAGYNREVWPLNRILSEATLELNHFLEPHMAGYKQLTCATKRVRMGAVAESILNAAEEESADLVIMSPRRGRGLRHWIRGSVTEQVTRKSPCPVLSITPPLPSQPWRGKLVPHFFGWPRESVMTP